MAKKQEQFTPRLILDEGNMRVVRTGPESMVIEERHTDALGVPAWRAKVSLDPYAVNRVENLVVVDLYRIFSAIESAR